MTLRMHGVGKSLGGRVILAGIDLDLAPGESLRLVGPSGLGKSTLLGLAAGILRPDAGRIEHPARVAMSFQEEALLPWTDALGNLLYALAALPDAAARARVWLARFDLPPALRPAEMSGGMCRRLALARAFAAGAPLLLLDEPFAFLDAPWRQAVSRMIDEAAGNGAAVLFSTHQTGDDPASTRRTLTIDPLGGLRPVDIGA